MTCDSVIIINRGQVVASDSLANLAEKASQDACLIAVLEGEVDDEALRLLPGLTMVVREQVENAVRLKLSTTNMNEMAARLCSLADQFGWRVRAVHPERRTLEDLFVEITGSSRDLDL